MLLLSALGISISVGHLCMGLQSISVCVFMLGLSIKGKKSIMLNIVIFFTNKT